MAPGGIQDRGTVRVRACSSSSTAQSGPSKRSMVKAGILLLQILLAHLAVSSSLEAGITGEQHV